MKIAQDGGAILFFHDKVKELHDGIEVFCGGGDSENRLRPFVRETEITEREE